MSAARLRATASSARGSSSAPLSHHVVDQLARHLDVALEADVPVVDARSAWFALNALVSTRVAPGGQRRTRRSATGTR